jgi:hypothetical protein
MIKKCVKCNQDKEHHAKGLCYECYRAISWKPKKGTCKRCKREIILHAKGLCPGCYNFVFHLDNNKAWNQKKSFGIDSETYRKLTEKCVICGFDKVVDLHHLDENKKNNSLSNLIGLCPNHHQMLHNFKFRKEIRELLKQKGHNLPIDKKLDFKLEK